MARLINPSPRTETTDREKLVTRAIIYVPAADYAESADICFEHLHACGYEFTGLVLDWPTAKRMMDDDECTVTVVADERLLDPGRKPRIEVASRRSNGGKRWDERTRLIRRRTWEG